MIYNFCYFEILNEALNAESKCRHELPMSFTLCTWMLYSNELNFRKKALFKRKQILGQILIETVILCVCVVYMSLCVHLNFKLG